MCCDRHRVDMVLTGPLSHHNFLYDLSYCLSNESEPRTKNIRPRKQTIKHLTNQAQ